MLRSYAASLFPWSLLLLRLVVGSVFLSSGWSHLSKPRDRSKSIEMPVWFTALLGWVEALSAVAIAVGVYLQIAALLLFGTMLGAIGFKIFRWDQGYFAENGFGWHYDALLAATCFVLFCTRGGALVILG